MTLNPADITWGIGGSASAHGSFVRSTQDRSYRLHMTHKPTGLHVAVQHGPARLSKRQWQAKKQEMFKTAMNQLTAKVARKAKRVAV